MLKIGLKCGGSDGLSGITANPLVGRITDEVISMGGTCVLTEVPEMFGAEQILMNRCVDETVFNDTANLINHYKNYIISHNQPVSENPSPGNKEGGITTLEENHSAVCKRAEELLLQLCLITEIQQKKQG